MKAMDFLIIGSGAAGLATALGLTRFGRVAVLSKDQGQDSATLWAQGGMAAVMKDTDSIAAHIQDTLNAGAGLCHPQVVRQVVEHGAAAARSLIAWGVPFTHDEQGDFHLTREGGHSARRILHTADATGRAIEETLLQRVREHPAIFLGEGHFAIDLWVEDGICRGAMVLTPENDQIERWSARTVILATGGAGQVYLHTSNPPVATGDGIAMAYRAGAEVANMEFMQFHPTTLYHPGSTPFLLSEALRGEGAKLRLPDGSTFLERYDPRAELAPRDIVARAIDAEMKRHGLDYVLLDISHQPAAMIQAHFPTIAARCLELGLDITREPIPVVPAAHYTCGGVVVDGHGRSTLAGLYAAGEAACTGLHGANRLASNSLLECITTAAAIVADLQSSGSPEPASFSPPPPPHRATAVPTDTLQRLRNKVQTTMWAAVGIVRQDAQLQEARKQLEGIGAELRNLAETSQGVRAFHELRNLQQTALLITQSAIARRESRGCHYNEDHPQRASQALDTIMQRDWPAPRQRPIPPAA
ncbi:MAG: L-aspartate oxidase [Acidithiobacillus sp.]|uniref:L-aspartate oxidase n=1 Tax=Acidithiobacillus sp. TaxID=1872118 RepID=UPI003CFCCEE0